VPQLVDEICLSIYPMSRLSTMPFTGNPVSQELQGKYTLTYGVPEPTLVFVATPNLTNAGGPASLTGAVGISIEGLICKDTCDGVGTGAQAQSGSSLSSTPP